MKSLHSVLHKLALHWFPKDTAISKWSFSRVENVLLLEIERDGDVLQLRFFVDGDKYWKCSTNFKIAIGSGNPTVFEQFPLSNLIANFQKLDQGQIVFDKIPTLSPVEHTKNTNSPSANGFHPPTNDISHFNYAAHKKYEKELHWMSFLGVQSANGHDLYPHTGDLGIPITTEQILEYWAQAMNWYKQGVGPTKLGLYTHLPFCSTACTFCYCGKTDNFNKSLFQDYFQWLMQQASLFAPIFQGITFTSWYFGGGTPSLLPSDMMAEMFETFHRYFHIEEGTQAIYEGNPDSLSDRKIEVMGTIGKITRLTIGAQTLDEKVQALVKRFNKPHQLAGAVESARKWNIPFVNVDLMTGLPGQTFESFQHDLEFVLSLQPDSVHINAYRPLKRISLHKKVGYTKEAQELRDKMTQWAFERLVQEGHGDQIGQPLRRTQNAANVQEFDLRTQNSNLLGLGTSALSHAFAGAWYTTAYDGNFDTSLQRMVYDKDEPRWLGVPTSIQEEKHKFVIRNFASGINRATYKTLFHEDCLQTFEKAFAILDELGVLKVSDEKIQFDGPSACVLVYRGFLYGEDVCKRIEDTWKNKYDAHENYYAQLDYLLDNFSMPLYTPS